MVNTAEQGSDEQHQQVHMHQALVYSAGCNAGQTKRNITCGDNSLLLAASPSWSTSRHKAATQQQRVHTHQALVNSAGCNAGQITRKTA